MRRGRGGEERRGRGGEERRGEERRGEERRGEERREANGKRKQDIRGDPFFLSMANFNKLKF
jgi:hypothetical protein